MTQYVHPEFGILCPTPHLRRRLRVLFACAAVASIGLAVMATADSSDPDGALAVAAVDEDAGAEAIPFPSFAPIVIGTARRGAENALTDADKPSCVGDTSVHVDSKCVVSKPRKPRMVRVPTYRPAIASVPLGRTTALMGATESKAPAAAGADGRQGDASKSALAASSDAAATASTEPAQQPAAATRKKKTAHSQNRRRDPYGYGYGYDRWREVRVDDWSARGYAPRQRDYPRGGYGQGFRSFW
jgi:hypothetical protein